MGRIRTIKPEFWKHEDLSELPEATHMLAAALLNYADDEGYFNANPGLVRSECSPLREPSVSIQESLAQLSNIGFIRLGSDEAGKRYGAVCHFLDHQRINRPTASKIKHLHIVWDDAVSAHTQLSEASPPELGTGNREGEGNSGSSLRSEPQLTDADEASDSSQPAAAKLQAVQSDEDRFWDLAGTAVKRGVPRSMCGKLANRHGGVFSEAIGALNDALSSKEPRKYLGKILSTLADETGELDPITQRRPGDPKKVPGWVLMRREMGADVRWKPPDGSREGRWVWGREEYADNDQEDLIAC